MGCSHTLGFHSRHGCLMCNCRVRHGFNRDETIPICGPMGRRNDPQFRPIPPQRRNTIDISWAVGYSLSQLHVPFVREWTFHLDFDWTWYGDEGHYDKIRVDFFLPGENIALEIDGWGHAEPFDRQRDECLYREHGIRTYRIDSRYLLKFDEVFQQVVHIVKLSRDEGPE